MKTASAQKDGTVNQDASENREQKLNQLLNRIKGRPGRVVSAARMLSVEVDGEVIGHTETSMQAVYFGLPGDARSVSLKDESGVVRAHLLLTDDYPGNDLTFDSNRITLSVVESSNPSSHSTRLVVRCHPDDQP